MNLLFLLCIAIFGLLSIFLMFAVWPHAKSAPRGIGGYRNITPQYLKWVASEKDYFRSSPKTGCTGGPSAGKTLLSVLVLNQHLTTDTTREWAIPGPQEYPRILAKKAPYPDRIYHVKTLADVENDAFYNVDEALALMSGKRWMSEEAKRIGEGVVYMSHKRIGAWINMQDLGIFKDLRLRLDFLIHKSNTALVLQDKDRADAVMRANANLLFRLPPEYSLLISNYKAFPFSGYLFATQVDIDRAIPWWDAELSTNLAKISLDSQLQKSFEEKALQDSIVELLVAEQPRRCIKAGFANYLAGYILEQKGQRIYDEVKPYFKNILVRCCYKAEEKLKASGKLDRKPRQPSGMDILMGLLGMRPQPQPKEEEDLQLPQSDTVEIDLSQAAQLPPKDAFETLIDYAEIRKFDFPTYASKFLNAINADQKFVKAIFCYESNLGMLNIAHECKCSLTTVESMVKKFQNSFQGRLWEIYWDAKHPGGKLGGGNTDTPDWISEVGEVWTLKHYASKRKTEYFYQQAFDHKHGFGPEYRESGKRGLQTYKGGFRNPWKKPQEFILEFEREKPNKLEIIAPTPKNRDYSIAYG